MKPKVTAVALPKKHKKWGILIGILALSINLRPSISGVGPILDLINVPFHLSKGLLGLLTTLPLLAFALISNIAPYFTRRFGTGKTLFGAMILLAAGIFIRSIGSVFALYFGTVLLGISIAFANVLIPVVIKQKFPDKAGMMTGLQSATMAFGSTIAAGIRLPLAQKIDLGWEGSLALWGGIALIAAGIWWPQIKKLKATGKEMSLAPGEVRWKIQKSRLAWNIAAYMGLQSLTFYVIVAWLPEILKSFGYDALFAGNMLSFSQFVGILGSLVFPYWAGKRKDQRLVLATTVVLGIMGFLGLIWVHSMWIIFWVGLLGFVTGGTFGLALLLIILRAPTDKKAAKLSGFAQSIGYIIAGTGPFMVGFIQDIAHDWTYAILFMVLTVSLQLIFGLKAAKNQVV